MRRHVDNSLAGSVVFECGLRRFLAAQALRLKAELLSDARHFSRFLTRTGERRKVQFRKRFAGSAPPGRRYGLVSA